MVCRKRLLLFEIFFSVLPKSLQFLHSAVLSGSVFHWQILITCIFSISLKFGACYITGQWGEFRVMNTILCLHILFWYVFFLFFVLFFIKKICFYHFHFSFWWSTKFPQQNINQSETGIGEKKLSVELYAGGGSEL